MRLVAVLKARLRDKMRSTAVDAAKSLERAAWQPETPEEQAWFYVATGDWVTAVNRGPVSVKPLINAVESNWKQGDSRLPERPQAIRALTRIEDKATAVTTLIGLLQNGGPDFQDDNPSKIAAVSALGDLGDPRAVEAIVPFLTLGSSHTRLAAAKSLGQLKDPRAFEAINALLTQGTDGDLRLAAIDALGALGDKRALQPLIELLPTSDAKASVAAARALGQLGDPSAAAPLGAMLESAMAAAGTGREPRPEDAG